MICHLNDFSMPNVFLNHSVSPFIHVSASVNTVCSLRIARTFLVFQENMFPCRGEFFIISCSLYMTMLDGYGFLYMEYVKGNTCLFFIAVK